MNIQVPENPVRIIHELEEAGFEAYVVGGCVRDMLMGRTPKDWDITTSALPEQVKRIFPHTVDTGIEHGTVTVLMGEYPYEAYEVTTYRLDGDYQDHRHPTSVEYTPSLKEDLKRRDFTINAMAYHPKKGLVDLFDGYGDISRGMLRCVGEAEIRFEEDALRMMRGIRFCAQLGFQMESSTREALKKKASSLAYVSKERIRDEFMKILRAPHLECFLWLVEGGLMEWILPEFLKMLETPQNNPHHCHNVGIHSLKVVEHIKKVLKEREDKESDLLLLAGLLHDVAKPETRTTDARGVDHFYGHPEKGEEMAKEILKTLKFDNDTKKKVSQLVRYHEYYYDQPKASFRRYVGKVGKESMPLMFCLQEADIMGQSEYQREDKIRRIQTGKIWYQELVDQHTAVRVKELAVTGKEILELGYTQGPEIGACLQKLLEYVMEHPDRNTKEELLRQLQREE